MSSSCVLIDAPSFKNPQEWPILTICQMKGGSYHLGASWDGPAHPARKSDYAPIPASYRTDPVQGSVDAGPVVASEQPYLRNTVVSFEVG